MREVVAAHVLRESRGERGPKFNRGGSFICTMKKMCKMNPGTAILTVYFRAGAGI